MNTKTITLNTETINTLLIALSAAYGAACDAVPRHKGYVTSSSRSSDYTRKLNKAITEFKDQIELQIEGVDYPHRNDVIPEFVPPPGEFSGCRCPDCPEKQTPKRVCFCCTERRLTDKYPDSEPIL